MDSQPQRTLVLGGTRSGKSAHAEGLLRGDGPVDYLATARRDPGDAEWSARIAEHVARRPAHWRTTEVPVASALAAFLRSADPGDPPILVDDIATWVTGVLDDTGWDRANRPITVMDDLVAAVAQCRARLVLVSAEVGLGVVPSTSAGRLFRDELGALNADLAAQCDEVLLLVAGIPLRLR
ncbi:bifunctional adenosylcobinamide kinase/adenosylcobinamide-phosphate guanylyltransferase [Actinokineospora globicatena]|uniref:bifunctional adenosylcobinamide kinase/adenosylcobinamide-phosphate guanylyltransferase n=1 Tax=Actinokineospora globicatena TaxID=103729 RepID=UPI0020A3B9FE|nr:bifunctional adenosylcobinamide kinase/adenosylcobinamide-phosphate guanylyltransferase [Actinokineospora globicatena]MCP2304512.1 adenosylcobinamide kinase /adenosylcobinamide-phosphate guanylyltransferase [Actinokineospora globicatena]GLW78120.1 putative cobinamide kinase/cobinamide phosphate guanylyltransferase CobU [Actinokineospora globicatena]GLW85214.1 putative cobinamide kinase/cobinamide phosphate guanylyltransferase CobU [Actinokineospora globicatena]